MENEKKAVGMSQNVCVYEASVRNRKQEAERASQNQECQENKYGGAEERTKDACSPQKQLLSLLSSCPPHQLTQLRRSNTAALSVVAVAAVITRAGCSLRPAPGELGTGSLRGQACPGSRFQLASCGGQHRTGLL